MDLTPNKLVIARKKIEPLAQSYGLQTELLFDEFKEKYAEFKGLVEPDVIIQLIKKRLIEDYGEPQPPSPILKYPIMEKIISETGITPKEIEKLVEEKRTELKGLITEEGALFLVTKELGIIEEKEPLKPQLNIGDNMKDDFWDKVEIDSEEFPPWFKIENGLLYSLELVDPSAKPRPHKNKISGRPQWIWDVKLIDINKKEAFSKTDENGHLIYVKNRVYSLAMGKRAMQRFRTLWEANDFSISQFNIIRTGAGFQTDYIFSV